MAYLSLTENVVGRTDFTNKRPHNICLSETRFFGTEKEEAKILKLLIGEVENSDAMLSIIPIVGMGSVGKTALAQRLYNDANASGYFERRAWVCVSDVFDVLNITKAILQLITKLSFKLKDSLSGKKFLVVLDDVWDYKIKRDELVLLWIVEGFLDGQKRKENNLRLGWNYFDELVCRSFLQESSVIASKFSMHDFLNDLAKSIVACYASFISSWSVTSKCLRASYRMKVLRSLMLLQMGSRGGNKFYISNEVLYDLLIELKYLRVVSLCHCDIIEQGLSNMFLHWSEDFGNLWKDKHEAQVLHSLQPRTNLENLTISYYGGAIFPSWLDGPFYCKLVSLCLRGCPNVISLPQLGQLPLLKKLCLNGLHAVRMIDFAFYGGEWPFSSLTTLKFEEMLAWNDWSRYAGGPEEEHLVVRSCHSLVGTLLCQLDHLIKLEIHLCPHLKNSTSAVCLPFLYKLYLKDCNRGILKCLVNITSLIIVRVQNLAELVCFNHEIMSYLVKLKELHIRSRDKLTYLWQDGNETRNLTCHQELSIQSCTKFMSFVAEEGEIELPFNLETMELRDCASLEKLRGKMHTLKDLLIEKYPKLVGLLTITPNDFTSNPMPQLAAVKTLIIGHCEGVELLEEIVVELPNSMIAV
ncbi:hypothetical protein EUGRSUZ_B01078 [Eucalyptus grandis]|uniref:Uncharacterized protein n=2 Tax=Eucalyptus grandis TaxID=71139 RepID=A0ACC3LPG3_EUCGR|nr:hypothetical protein EUGRSUZ_B01078 [Eucalyptus grandis]